MEDVFLVHYEKSEVDSGSRCGYSDTIPESFDAEVLGVYLQRSDANRCARDKVAELRDGSSYFEDSGDPFYADEDVSWEGTGPDDVGRSITDRVYVSQQTIEDPSPTKKRARTATDAGDMTFEAAEPFLAAMKQGELVAAIGRAWDQSPALRSQLEAATADTWCRAPDQSKMLEHNWEDESKRSFVRFKEAAALTHVHIGNVWQYMEMDGIRELLEGENGELAWEDQAEDDEGQCEECNAPGSTCTVILQVNRQGDLRLVADSEIRCYCNSLGGGAEVVDTGHATFRIAAPARKTRRKAK